MWRSVPQIEAARTLTNTSIGPGVGTGTDSKCAPRSGRILRKAFIVGVGIVWEAVNVTRQNCKFSTRGNERKIGDAEAQLPLQSRRLKIRTSICGGILSFSDRFEEIRTGFERPFWVANVSELFERLSYYAAFASLARYLHETLNFPVEQAG